MSLEVRQSLFALLAFVALVYLVAGLAIVYLTPHTAPVVTLSSGAPDTAAMIATTTRLTLDALVQVALVVIPGLTALALFAVLSWRCNVRLREDAYHRDTLRALAAVIKAVAPSAR